MTTRALDPLRIEDGQEPSNSQVVAALARASATPTILTPQYTDAPSFIVLRNAEGAEQINWLKERKDPPARKVGSMQAHDATALIELFKVHGAGVPVIYASLLPAVKFTAVLNDHTETQPGYRDFKLDYVVKHSAEWISWIKQNGPGNAFDDTASFARFIEQNAPDFVEPSAGDMMEMALNFRIRQGVIYDNAQRLQDGRVELNYRVTNQAVNAEGSVVTIPERFKINLRVWDGPTSELYPIYANFRYRLREGELTMWYELERPDRLIEQAFRDLVKQIEDGTGAKVLFASPGV